MRESRNPFRLRRSESIDTDAAFLALFEPGILELCKASLKTFEALGYAFSGGFQDDVDIDFLDLDADGRKDLVTVTLDFSVFQLLRVMTAKKIGASGGVEARPALVKSIA